MILLDLSPLAEIIHPSVKIFWTSTITSKDKEHRKLLRKEVSRKLNDNSPSLSNLDLLPVSENFNLSLSHSPKGMGFACSDKNNLVGFDMEDPSRLNKKLITRISNPEEIKACPHPDSLLCAKEASWKALNNTLEIPTISHIETTSWKSIDSQWLQFKIKTSDKLLDGSGFFTEHSGIYISFFTINSTFV